VNDGYRARDPANPHRAQSAAPAARSAFGTDLSPSISEKMETDQCEKIGNHGKSCARLLPEKIMESDSWRDLKPKATLSISIQMQIRVYDIHSLMLHTDPEVCPSPE